MAYFVESQGGPRYDDFPAQRVEVDKESPMFSLVKVNYEPKMLKQLVVCSDMIVMAQANGHVIRLNLNNPAEIDDIAIIQTKKPENNIFKIHLDPTGNHLLVSMTNEENYYLHSKQKKAKKLDKVKGLISAVAWDQQKSDPNTTGIILLGTTQGKILQTIFEATPEKGLISMVDKGQPVKLLYTIETGSRSTITGLRYERWPGEASPGDSTPKYFIMASTPSRIYQFIGTVSFESLFNYYQEGSASFEELPGEMSQSDLVFYNQFAGGMAESFAWLTGPGIYSGNLIYGSQNQGEKVTTEVSLLGYDEIRSNGESGDKSDRVIPVALGLTEFHFLLLTGSRFYAVNKLSHETVYVYGFSQRVGEMIGLAMDPIRRTRWVYSDRTIFEVIVNDEDRDVWELYLNKNQFEIAEKYCKGQHWKLDRVHAARADFHLAAGQKDLAAQYYAKTSRAFEEVALKFISDREALITYLSEKLREFKGSRSATQPTVIATWLLEIYLNKLNDLKIRAPSMKQSNTRSRDNQGVEYFRQDVHAFLKENLKHLFPPTVFNLITSNGCLEEYLFFARLIHDYDRIVSHYLQREEFAQAIAVLSQLSSTEEEMFYKFLPVLMQRVPYETVNMMMGAAFLDAARVIPALMYYDETPKPQKREPGERGMHQGIRYLQYVVFSRENKDMAVHNYLISLYAKSENEDDLVAFIARPPTYFDNKYALRVSTERRKYRACVMIYSALGLFEEAVDMALTVDIELAKANAEKPGIDRELKKRLWLRIAKKVISEQKDIKLAMEFLKQCSDTLKIEDILPFFSGFVRIGDFKEEITESLKEYNQHISQLKADMDAATDSAKMIREDIQDLRNKYGFLRQNQKCNSCGYPVIHREMYLFPCQHCFHAECLIDEVYPNLKETQQNVIRGLRAQIQVLEQSVDTQTDTVGGGNAAALERLRNDLDEVIAYDCPHCGDLIIKSIAKPFIEIHEIGELSSWNI